MSNIRNPFFKAQFAMKRLTSDELFFRGLNYFLHFFILLFYDIYINARATRLNNEMYVGT